MHYNQKYFLAENVKGILSANKGEAIKIITKRFEETGYKLKVQLVNFADYGVPQLRQRVLFIGVRKDIDDEFNIPQPTHKDKHVTTKEAFKKINKNCINNNLMRQLPTTTAKLEAIPEGGNFKDLPPELAVKALMSNIYRKLERNKPAYTVLASGGGGTWSYHYEEPRALTNRERARLQTFPDDLIFKGSNTEVRRQIGNAVPAVGVYPFAKEIERILKTFQTKEHYNLKTSVA
jgi:DNA (cytosine-5)-methyltransferase 1